MGITVLCLPAWSLPFKSEAGAAVEKRMTVFVSIVPQIRFIEKITGGGVDVEALVLPGQSPATYEPTPRQLHKLGKASLYFTIGVPFESGLIGRISKIYPDLKIVDSGRGISRQSIEGHDNGHHHDLPDPHIWLSPSLIVKQVNTMTSELTAVDPANGSGYRENAEEFIREIRVVHDRLADLLEPYAGRSFYIFHPSLGYFANEYHLNQVAIESGGKPPTPRQLARFIEQARKEDIRAIFIQKEFDRRNAQSIAQAIDARVIQIDPLTKDVLAGLEEIGRELAGVFTRSNRSGGSETPLAGR